MFLHSDEHPNSFHCSECEMVDITAGHYKIRDASQIAEVIHQNYKQTSVVDETIGHYHAARGVRRFVDGTLIKLQGKKEDYKYYVMESGMKRLIPSKELSIMLRAYNYTKPDLIEMTNITEFNAIRLYDYLVLP
jgi:hypothetical protein